jgi:hypothetical protein
MSSIPPSGEAAAGLPPRFLAAQFFEGAFRISADALSTATGLKKGDLLTPKLVNAVRQIIIDKYAELLPGAAPSLRCKMQTTVEGNVTLTWVIGEPE